MYEQTSVILNRGVIQGVAGNSDVALTTTSSQYLLGETIVFNSTLTFAANEENSLSQVRLLNTTGGQLLDVDLPVQDTSGHSEADADGFVDISGETSDTGDILKVKVTFNDIQTLGGTLPSGTLPGTLPSIGTLPAVALSTGGNFSAGSSGGTISYEVHWTPAVALSPVPDLTLIPATDTFFTIPTVATPEPVAGTTLGDTGFAWNVAGSEGDIPTAGTTAGTELPSATSTFAVPQITISTNAPEKLPAIPDSIPYLGTAATSSVGFAIPGLTVATSSAASFPAATEEFDIPAPTIATSSVSNFGSAQDEQWLVPDTDGTTSTPQVVKGMTHDGTNFWFILAGASRDSVISVNSSGILQASSTAPSRKFDGIAAVGSSIYIIENKNRCYDEIQTDTCYNSRILKIASSGTLPSGSTDADWAVSTTDTANAVTAVINIGNDWDKFGGLTVGASGDLWAIHDQGEKFYNLRTSGIEKASYQGQWNTSNALGFSSNLLYTANGSTVTRWTDQGQKVDDTSVSGTVKALTFDGNTMYFVNNDDGKVYATFVGMSVDSPITSKGVAYSTDSAGNTSLWILVDGSPKDYIVKVNPSDGTLVTGFGTDVASDGTRDGWAQAPSADTEGIEYFDSALYVISNESGEWDTQRKLYKLNVTTGGVESGYPKNLSDQNVFDDLGDVTNNGTNLVAWSKTMNEIYTIPTAGTGVQSWWVNGVNWQGTSALAYHPTQQLYYAANGTQLSKLDTNYNQISTATLSTSGTPFSDVQGMTFSDASPYNDLWFVTGPRVYHSFISAAATTQPLAIAWSSDEITALGSTESLWVIVDASPFDQIMRVDTSDGTLNTTFDSDGIADAPSGNIEGAVFVTEGNDNFLYMVANDPGQDQWSKKKNLYKYNVKTNVVVSGYPYNLQDSANVYDDMGGLTYDGTNLIVSAKTHGSMWKVSTTGGMVTEAWPCCVQTFGIAALAYHSGRDTLYGAKNAVILTLSTDLQTITETNATLSGSSMSSDSIGAMTFGSDVLYIARTSGNLGYITAAAFSSTVLTTPQGLTLSPSGATYLGASVGAALWVVVDGTPKDRVLKLTGSGSSWALDTNFGSDSTKNGSAELPNANITGVSFYNNALWVIGKPSWDPVLYKLNPVTGAELNSYQLCGGMMFMGPGGGGGGGGGMQMCEDPGGMSHDGTNFIVSGAMEERFWFINDSGQVQNEMGAQYQLGGAQAVDKIQSDNTYWTTKGTKIQSWINPFGNDIWPSATYTNSAGMDNIKGLVIDQTSKTIYMGWNDGANPPVGYISQAVPPSPITNNPLDLAYNVSSTVLYVLVDGSGGDVVVALNPNTGAIIENPDGSQRFYTLNSEDATSLAYLNGKIYAVYEERQGEGSWGPPPAKVTVLNQSLEEEAGSPYNMSADFGRILGLASNGSQLIGTVQYGGARLDMYDINGFNRGQEVHFWDPNDHNFSQTEGFSDVAFTTSTPMYYVSKGNSVYRIDEQGGVTDSWGINAPGSGTLNSIEGLAFGSDGQGGELLYLADSGTDKIYTAKVPLPAISITNNPRAMATDGTSMWIAVDADPVDKILKFAVTTSTPSSYTSFDSPGGETDGLAIHDGKLWVLTNDTETIEMPSPGGQSTQMQITLSMLFSLDKSTGAELSESVFMLDIPYQGPDFVKTLMGGLTSDGQYLYTASIGDPSRGDAGKMFRVDLDNPLYKMKFGMMIGGPRLIASEQFQGVLTKLESIQAMTVATTTAGFDEDRRLIVAGAPGYGNNADRISRFDLEAVSSGAALGAVMQSQYTLSGKDIKGLAYVGTILYMADSGGTVIGTALPENTGVEMTMVGSYTTSLSAVTDVATYSDSASYSVVRNTDVRIEMTTPTNDFVATSSVATIAGRINDPAIASVSVGIQLPSTDFLDDPGDTDSSGKWTTGVLHGSGVVNWFQASGGKCPSCGAGDEDGAWRFGKPGVMSFDEPGSRVAGSLTSNDVLPVNEGTILSFSTAWDTEFQADMDKKFIQIASVTTDLQGNDVVGTYKNIAQLVQFVDQNFMPMPTNVHEDLFYWLQAPPLPFTPGQQHNVVVDLSPLAGQRIKVRFKFDSMDEFANEGQGWFVDNIKFTGSGTKTITINTVMLDPTVDVVYGTSTVTYYRIRYRGLWIP